MLRYYEPKAKVVREYLFRWEYTKFLLRWIWKNEENKAERETLIFWATLNYKKLSSETVFFIEWSLNFPNKQEILRLKFE